MVSHAQKAGHIRNSLGGLARHRLHRIETACISQRLALRTNPFCFQTNPIESGSRRHVESLAVAPTPGTVGRDFRRLNRTEMGALGWRRSRPLRGPYNRGFHSCPPSCMPSGMPSSVSFVTSYEDRTVGKAAVRLQLKAHANLPCTVGIGDVEILFVPRESKPIGKCHVSVK